MSKIKMAYWHRENEGMSGARVEVFVEDGIAWLTVGRETDDEDQERVLMAPPRVLAAFFLDALEFLSDE